MSFKKRLLDYLSLTERDYERLVEAPAFSSLPQISKASETEKAISRLKEAERLREKVLVYGDYDADGILSSAILVSAFREKGLEVDGYIPSRYLDGYGLNPKNVERIAKKGFRLLVLSDNGITAYEGIEKAKSLGLDVIVVDHHEPDFEKGLPEVSSIVHPRTISYPAPAISAGFLAFLFSWAYLGYPDERYLSLGALSLISDMMPLVGHNRDAVRLMKGLIDSKPILELSLLAQVEKPSFLDLQMKAIPTINAIGRIEEGTEVNRLLRFFLEEDPKRKKALSSYFIEINEKRKSLTKEAIASLELPNEDIAYAKVLALPEGLNGLLANRIVAEKGKPTAIFSAKKGEEGVLVGSIRGGDNLNVLDLFDSLSFAPLHKGGHPGAGGMSVKEGDFSAFVKDFRFMALKSRLNGTKKKVGALSIDRDDLIEENAKLVLSLAPFGPLFPEPVFKLGPFSTDSLEFSLKGDYLMMRLNPLFRLVSFKHRKGGFSTSKVFFLARLRENSFRGKVSYDLLVEEAEED